jgi:putative ubiquitin-RnfH superfamily antitoxin RatB of RatAB toxin-antitoxin module
MPERNHTIEVLYALPDEQAIVELDFEQGMTARDAVVRSGLPERYPEIAEQDLALGVWGVEVPADFGLRVGDRVEISRPLLADPRDMRRTFINDGRVMGGAVAPESGIRKTDRA